MNFDEVRNAPSPTKPALLADTKELANVTRDLTKANLKKLMGISDNLAALNHARFQALQATAKARGSKPAALAFNGDVYLGLDANSLANDDLDFAQDRIRILSGLYGLLRPLDAIEPYRLEMGSKLANQRGKNLYEFWGTKISAELKKILKTHTDKTIVNLASIEYFSAVDQSVLSGFNIITPIFKEEKDGQLRQLQFYAKRARGEMARWAIQKRIDKAQALKKYSVGGYKFDKAASDETTWLFTRPQPPKKT